MAKKKDSFQFRDRIKELRRVPANELNANPKNWRRHSEGQLKALRGLLTEIGFAGAELARELPDGSLELIDGHARASLAGKQEVPVLILDVTEAESDKILATFDPIGAMADQDDELLMSLLESVETEDAAVQEMLDSLVEDEPEPVVEVTEDDIPDPVADPVVQPGDLWVCGDHRVLCGDSTKAKDVERLMVGERAVLMNTDPPYGVSYANSERPNPGVAKPRVANDELADEVLQAFLESAFRAAVSFALTPNAAWYLWHAHLTQGYFAAAAAAAANVVLHRQIIWVKPVLLLGRGQYHWKHEPCFMGWVKGGQPPDYGKGNGERTQTTVWELASVSHADRKEFDHSTPKPVSLFAIPIVKHSKPGEIVYEPFAGSFPQLIAAEQLGRRCFANELDPKFVQCGLERWKKLTGKEPILQSTGQTWSEVKSARENVS